MYVLSCIICMYMQYVGSDMQLLLVGNKCDLNSERTVSHAEAEQVCIHICIV